MAKFAPSIPLPPGDVVDTPEEVRAYYRDMERELDHASYDRPDPSEY